MYRSFIFIILIGLLFFAPVNAQSITPDISITLSPQEPQPGNLITATAESFSINLDEALITWKYNNTIVESGQGKKNVKIIAPKSDTPATLLVSARGVEGEADATIVIRSASIDVIWEAPDSYTHPFYKGKALAPIGGVVRVVAIPNSSAPKTLSYYWGYNGQTIQNQSGSNRLAFVVQTDELKQSEKISVSVAGGQFSGTGNVFIPLKTPSLVLYEKSNGYIDFSSGTTNRFSLTRPSSTLHIEPFNITTIGDVDSSVNATISLDGEIVQGRELPISRPDTPGVNTIVVTLENLKKRFQTITQSFVLEF